MKKIPEKASIELRMILAFIAVYILMAVMVWRLDFIDSSDRVQLQFLLLMILTVLVHMYSILHFVRTASRDIASQEKEEKPEDRGVCHLSRWSIDLLRNNEQLYLQDRNKAELISFTVHQLQTPLAGIKWILSTLMSDGTDNFSDDQRKLVQQTYESNEWLISLVNDLLHISRIESGRLTVESRSLDPREVMNVVIDQNRRRIEQKELQLKTDFPEDLPDVHGDFDKIKEALKIVLSNAISYTESGGEIKAYLFSDQDYVVIAVADNGTGIPRDERGKIFRRYYRSRRAKKMQSHGTGLGLYIAQELMTCQDGYITCDSREGEGSTFYLYLPVDNWYR